jgi:beta-glucanase (GH16 family)
MRHFYRILFLLLVAGGSPAFAQTLVWSDEFSQPRLDAEKWTYEVGGTGFGNGELQYYTSGEANVFVGSKTNAADTGYLVIEARRESYGVPPDNRQFTSGRIVTSGKFNVKYGTIQARIKLPNLQNGLWPAFWMLGANYPTDGWPRSGEIDILEAGFQTDWQTNVANHKSHSTVHWFQDNFQVIDPNAPGNGWWGNASATGSNTIAGNFYDDFHVFKITWTPTQILGYVDNVQFYTFNIPAGDPNFTEFTTNPYYLILNLAVGGSNFVGITDPAQITAPMPAQMIVDYVRVYANANTQTFQAKTLPRQTGTFGVFTETTPVTASLGASPTIDVWSNLTAAPTTPQEGSAVLSFTANPGNWFGLGIPTGATNVKNMQNFIDGTLRFRMKTTSSWPMSIGVISTANGNAQASTQSKTVRLDPAGANQYGLVRDGQWHEVVIPISAFGNVEFRSINTMFYLVGDAPSSAVTFAVDNIYWQDGTKVTPQNGNYILYSDTQTGVDRFDLGTDGNFFVWENTLTPLATTPSEGSSVLSFTHNNKGWFGAAFTPNNVHNLTAYKNTSARLVLSLKTSDTTTPFYLGMKSGTRDGEGQKWIAFEPGQTPYGFVRNGTWQTIQIPLSQLYESVNLMEVTQLLQILGTGNIANIALDNIYITGGGTAEPDNGGSNVAPVANAGADKAITLPTNSITFNGSGTDSDGTISSYAWTRISGPNTPTLSGATTATLSVSGTVAGTYVFRLTVTDNGALTASDDVTLTVNPAATVNLALLKPVTVSSIEAVGTPGSAAVDGVATSRWSSAFSDPQWLYVDLGATYSISQVKITWEAAYGRDYVVEVSPNASTWSPLRTVTGNTALVNDLTGLSGSGRYVRVYGTTRGTPYGYSIYELEVYGTAAGARTAAPESITPILAEEDPVFFYPNPAHDVLRIEGLADGTEVGFLSTTGARQYTQRVENQAVSIGHLPAGIYVVRYRHGARNVQKKLIKL